MRTITILKDTQAIDDDNQLSLLIVSKGKIYPIELVFDRQKYWLITLGYGQGDWLFEKESVAFSDNYLVSFSQAKFIYQTSITREQLEDLNNCLNKFQVVTVSRMRHFLSQTAHESGGLKWLKELASGSAYEGRKDLGNVFPGDGRKYKGSGVIQLTGRANYQALSNYLGDRRVMEGCDYVAKIYPFTSAGFWWHNNGMNALCDRGATVKEITKKVNGGYNGLADRQFYYNRACQVIK